MTVYARGYRPYAGAFGHAPGWWVIFNDTLRTALRRKAMRGLRRVFMLGMFVVVMILYVSISSMDAAPKRISELDGTGRVSWQLLREGLHFLYTSMVLVTALTAVLAGAGLVSDDLRTRALPLYLVRPIRPFDYALGKALVLPAVLFVPTFLAGPFLLVLVSLWQPPGQSAAFFEAHADLIPACAAHFGIASAAYTGLMLLLSSRSPRRGPVISLAVAAVFGGTMIQGLGTRTKGIAGELLRVAGIPWDSLVPILRVTLADDGWFQRMEDRDRLPQESWAVGLAVLLFVVGFYAAWRRARTVEVSG